MRIRLLTTALAISLFANGSLLYVYWKTRPDTVPVFDPFEINYNVTEDALVRAGYTLIPEDVPLLGKQVGDTVIYYQLEYDCGHVTDTVDFTCEFKSVDWRNCIIYLDEVDSSAMSLLAEKYDAEMISEFTRQRSHYDSNSLRADFSVRHKFTQAIFDCFIERSYRDEKKARYELSIQTQFPSKK